MPVKGGLDYALGFRIKGLMLSRKNYINNYHTPSQ